MRFGLSTSNTTVLLSIGNREEGDRLRAEQRAEVERQRVAEQKKRDEEAKQLEEDMKDPVKREKLYSIAQEKYINSRDCAFHVEQTTK